MSFKIKQVRFSSAYDTALGSLPAVCEPLNLAIKSVGYKRPSFPHVTPYNMLLETELSGGTLLFSDLMGTVFTDNWIERISDDGDFVAFAVVPKDVARDFGRVV